MKVIFSRQEFLDECIVLDLELLLDFNRVKERSGVLLNQIRHFYPKVFLKLNQSELAERKLQDLVPMGFVCFKLID